ncbi:MAG: hypothetical protein AAFY88_23405, partial [Acidobacteriota bacterium]
MSRADGSGRWPGPRGPEAPNATRPGDSGADGAPTPDDGRGREEPPLEPPPLRGSIGLRVAVYFLSVVLAISVAASEILRSIDSPEAVRAMSEPGAEIEPMLFLWLRLLTLPIVLAITLFFVRRLDRGRLRDIGIRLPQGSGVHVLLAVLMAAVPLVGWLLLA